MPNQQQIAQLTENIKTIASAENKTELEIINELLSGAAKSGHEEAIEVLLNIRQPMIQPILDEIHNRVIVIIDGDEVDHRYFDTFIWENFTPGDTVHIDHHELIPVSAVFKSFVGGVVRLETTDSSYGD